MVGRATRPDDAIGSELAADVVKKAARACDAENAEAASAVFSRHRLRLETLFVVVA